ncbi:hypothetical protein TKK_0015694 [Trichogramma kaykai]
MAVSTFNGGKKALLNIMKELDIHPGATALKYTEAKDSRRIYNSEYQAESRTKEARTAKRQRLHSPQDNSYVPGGN